MVIQLYAEIGQGDCTAKVIAEKLQAAGNENVQLRINSPGGLISDGIAIYNLIQQHGDVEAVIDGVCASIATVIMCGAKSVTMAKNAMLFIHSPLIVGQVEADAQELRKIADGLDMNENVILQTYVQKVKGKTNSDTLRAMMEKDTYIDAEQALAMGLVDFVIEDVLSDKAVNLHAVRLLNTGMEQETIPPIAEESPQPEVVETPKEEIQKEDVSVVPEWRAEFDELKAVNASLVEQVQCLVAKLEAISKPKEEPEAKNEKKTVTKAIRPRVENKEKSILEMDTMERARFIGQRLKK